MFSILFPGQGSQFVGMGQELYEEFDFVKRIYKKLDDTLGYSLSTIIFEGPETELKLTKNTQPAIMITGVVIFEVLKKKFNFNHDKAKFFAGHSLGEYTALVCANSISIETAATLLYERGKSMQDATPKGQGGMLAILGMTNNEVLEEIKKINTTKICEIANDNSPGQIVVSGNISALEILNQNLKKNSKKSIFLPVSAPFHCSLMKNSQLVMTDKIMNSNFQNPSPGIISNVSAKEETDSNKIKKLLIDQITGKVRWRESVEYILSQGVNNFLEIGPGKVLSGLVKRISKNVKIDNINNIEDIKRYIKNE